VVSKRFAAGKPELKHRKFAIQTLMSALFTGASALNVDTKGRIAVPTRHREALLEACEGKLVVTRNHEGGLMMFPQGAWDVFSAKISHVPMHLQWVKRLYIGHAQPTVMDATGRVLIAPELRAAAELGPQAVMLGMLDYFEIWEPSKYAAKEALDLARAGSSATAETFKDFVF
jgi:MraZ protein